MSGRENTMLDDVPFFVPSETCLACDGCCRFNCDVSEWRPKADSGDEDAEMYVDCIDDSQYLRVEKEGDILKCTLLDLETNKCVIYDDRPFECRLYPFLLVKDEGSVCISAHLSCPFVQDVLGTDNFDQYLIKLKAYFDGPEAKEFIKRNVALAGEYSDYKQEIKKVFDFSLE